MRLNIVKNLLLLSISIALVIIISLVVLEIYLRNTMDLHYTPGYTKTHPVRRYELRPNFTGKTFGVKYKVNSYGLRDFERPITRGDEALRIAVFGDSITFGSGVKLKKTFPKALETLLNEKYNKQIQVFNFGIPSYNTYHEFVYLKDSYNDFKPHLVLFEFTAGNDVSLADPPGGLKGINQLSVVRFLKDALRHLYSYDWLAGRYYTLRYKLLYRAVNDEKNRKINNIGNNTETSDKKINARLKHDELLYDESYKGWQETQKVFKSIADFCRRKNIPVIFAIYTNNINLSTSLESDFMYPIVNKIKDSLRINGIDHIVLLDDAFRGYAGREKELWVRPDNSHFSSLAHKLAGEQLSQYIIENNIIEED